MSTKVKKAFKPLEKVIKKGTKVRIKLCEPTNRHGKERKGCVCKYIGMIVEIGHPHWTDNVNAPRTYDVNIGSEHKHVTRSEIVVLKDQTVDITVKETEEGN